MTTWFLSCYFDERFGRSRRALIVPSAAEERGICFSFQFVGSALAVLCFALLLIASAAPADAAAKPVAWKPVDALLRIDEHPVGTDWNVYETGKKPDPLVLQLGGRYLYIVLRDHEIYELDPAKIQHRGKDLIWNADDKPEKPLETADWADRDIGLAFKIVVRLSTENRLVDLQLPHMLGVPLPGH